MMRQDPSAKREKAYTYDYEDMFQNYETSQVNHFDLNSPESTPISASAMTFYSCDQVFLKPGDSKTVEVTRDQTCERD